MKVVKMERRTGYIVDERDKKIISVLERDCRKSFKKIARGINASPGGVIFRIRNLEKLGIIKGYKPFFDLKKLGFDILALILVKIKSNYYLKILLDKLKQNINVIKVFEITGENDLAVIGCFKSNNELMFFVKKLLSSEEIEKTSTHIIVDEIEKNISEII